MEDGCEASDMVPTDEYFCECVGLGGWHCKEKRVQDSRFCDGHQNMYLSRNDHLSREIPSLKECQLLNKGQLVEVIGNDGTLVDSWFTAKIISSVPNGKINEIKFLIQYDRSLSGNNEVDPSLKMVASSMLRPPPPPLQIKSFELHQVVDAFCENGWWKGEIVEILENNTYSVYYSVWKVKRNFGAEDLRLHQDWIDGNWVIPQPMDRDVEKEDMANLSVEPEKTIPSRIEFTQEDGDVRNTDIAEGSDNSKGNIHQSWPRGRPPEELQEKDARENPLSKDFKRTTPPETRSRTRSRTDSCAYTNSMEKDFTLSDGDVRNTDIAEGSDQSKRNIHQSWTRGLRKKDARDSHLSKDFQRTMPPETRRQTRSRTRAESCTYTDSMEKDSTLLDKYSKTDDMANESDQRENKNSQMRPRGRTRKIMQKKVTRDSPIMEKQTNAILETKSPSKETVLQYSTLDLQEVALAHRNQVASQSEIETIPRETPMKVSAHEEESFHHNTDQDMTDIFTNPISLSDHPTANSNPGISSSVSDLDRRVNLESSISGGEQGNDVSIEDGALPFTKTISLWKTLEGMEVFQSMPQKPHFRTLADLNEIRREGTAISYMVTFAAVVKKTLSFQPNDTLSSIREILELLHDLEVVGFNVQPIRARLEKLISIKTTLLELEVEMKQVEEEISIEEIPLESETAQLTELTECLKKLEESSSDMVKKHDMLVMKMHADESEDTELQINILEAEKEVEEINIQFNSIVASLN